MIAETAVIGLPTWVRLRFDRVRDRWVLLAPERVLFPCATSVEIIGKLDPPRPFAAVLDELAAAYDAPREVLAADVTAMLDDLAAQGFLEVREPAHG